MAYPGPLIRITFGGTLPGSEEWQCGLSFANAGPPIPGANLQAAFEQFSLTDVANDVRDWFVAQESQFLQSTHLRWVKAALILASGDYSEAVPENPRLVEFGPTQYPGYAAVLMPNSYSLAVTLHSGSTLGKGNYGRFYPPPQTAAGDSATGLISQASASTFLQKTKEMLEAVQGEVDTLATQIKLVIPTEVGTAMKEVTELRIGRRPDTQRRRLAQIREQYVVSTMDQ